jgi:CRISPR-associated protein Cst2
VIATSTSAIPAPLVSPLAGGDDEDNDYRQQIAGVVKALNGNAAETVKSQTFDTISDFAAQMRALIDSSSPFAGAVGR